MNKVLGFILRILLLLLLLALICLGGWALHTYLDWDWWYIGALGLGLMALLILALVGRYFYYRYRERRYLSKIVDRDRPRISAEAEDMRLAELHERWRRGLDILRHAPGHLGNDIYALPWFVVMGESGSGKSTAITHARVSLGGGSNTTAKIASTHNCDWWFFEKAVVLDTAGRYTVPVDEGPDTREWEEFVRLLSAHRRKESLSGLILTLSTDQLERGERYCGDYGRQIRQRINTLMNALGADFPVYILVTKMDRVLGFTDLATVLNTQARNQVLGMLNKEHGARGVNMSFLEEALRQVRQRLRDMAMLFVVRARSGTSKAGLLSEELERLFPCIMAFGKMAFSPSTYGATPNLRGVFFSSSRQTGQAHSHLMEGLETFKDVSWHLPGTSNAYFLHDLFSTILPKERGISSLKDRWLTMLSFRRHLAYMIYLLFLLLLCAYFTISFRTRMNDMFAVKSNMPAAVSMSENLNVRMEQLSEAATAIGKLEQNIEKHRWLNPGASQANIVINTLREKYASWARPDLVVLNTGRIADSLKEMPAHRASDLLISLADYNVWIHKVLVSARDNKPFPHVRDSLDPLSTGFAKYIPVASSNMDNAIWAYARWEDPVMRESLINQTSLTMDYYLNALGADLKWITTWLNTRPSINSVRITDFWPTGPSDIFIPKAYTAEGRKRLEELLHDLSQATRDKASFDVLAAEYLQKHADSMRNAWWKMAMAFSRVAQENLAPSSWRRLGVQMSSVNNPYFSFIRSMGEVFATIADSGTTSSLDNLPGVFVQIMLRSEKDHSPETLSSSIIREKESLTAKVSQRAADELASLEDATKSFDEYVAALEALRNGTDSDEEALLMISTSYKGGQEATKLAVAVALGHVGQLQGFIDADGYRNKTFWNLVKGPVAWYAAMAISRSACALNELWTSSTDAIMHEEAGHWDTILNEASPVNKFLQGPCQPFIRRTRDGWTPTTWMGIRYPINQEFITYLNQGIDASRIARDKYTVSITALPINVNDMAQKPHRARLRLECGDNTQILDNYNYQTSSTFTWEPAVCGRVSLELSFENQTVVTSWDDHWAFQTFLRDFAGGEVVLTPEDFPRYEGTLRELDVTEIRVRYALRGATDAILALPSTNMPVPAEVAMCPGIRQATDSHTFYGLKLPDFSGMNQTPTTVQAPPAKSRSTNGGKSR